MNGDERGPGARCETVSMTGMVRLPLGCSWAAGDDSQGAYGAPVAILRAKSHPSSEAAYASSPKLPSARIDGSPTTGAEVQGVLTGNRSEEHTSELQSRSDLVCRL